MCLRDGNFDEFVRIADKKGMTNGEYVFLYYNTFTTYSLKQPWINIGNKTEEEKKAYRAFRQVRIIIIIIIIVIITIITKK